MPIYEYQCGKCAQITEALQKVSEAPLKKCPHCGGKVHKVMSLGSFHLKGDGWYVTDYKGKNSSALKTSPEPGAEPAGEKSKKTDKKKAAKDSSASNASGSNGGGPSAGD